MPQEFLNVKEDDLIDVCKFILSSKLKIIFLHGKLGAGKTTMSRHLIRQILGNKDLIVPSPTFAIINEYDTVFHIDLYRVLDDKNFEQEVLDLMEQHQNRYFVIEWGQEFAKNLKKSQYISVNLLATDDDTRIIKVE